MKIGIDAREFRSGRMTGIGRYLKQFLECGMSGRDNEYLLFCNSDTWVPVRDKKIREVIVTGGRFTVLWDQVFLPLYVLFEKPDVFLTPYFKAPFFLSCPTVLIINDLIPLMFPEEHSFGKRMYFEVLTAIAVRRAKKIIAISQYSKSDIMKYFQVPSRKIDVVYLGVEERFRYDVSGIGEIRKRYGLPEKYILYVGNLSPHKNIRTLINAYAGLAPQLKKEYKLVLGAGKKDKYYPGIQDEIGKLGLSEDVVVTDFILDDHLPVIYSASSLFVFPSLYEGFGLPPLEAMACGVAVITSNVSSLPEVAGDAALLVNPNSAPEIASAMESLLSNEELRNGFISRGLERAKKFSPQNMADNFMEVLKRSKK